MNDLRRRIGVQVNSPFGVERTIAAAKEVEELGFGTAWFTNGGPEDCIPLIAAIAAQTTTLGLGTSVMRTYPRHPTVLVEEVNVIHQLAPGRFRLGLGSSHPALMENLGIAAERPLAHLREYAEVVRTMTSQGSVAFDGEFIRAHARLDRAFEVPILLGALGEKSFEVAGRHMDGAITWVAPAAYLREVGLPAMERGAETAGRTRPKLVAFVGVAVHSDGDAVREAIRRSVPNIAYPAYQRMLVAAGFLEASKGVWTDDLVDAIFAWGDEREVVARVHEMFDLGADEVLLKPIAVGPNSEEVIANTLEGVARCI